MAVLEYQTVRSTGEFRGGPPGARLPPALTPGGRRVILPPSMRPASRRLSAPLAAAALLALAGCNTTPCEQLGNRLCSCVGGGTTRTSCETNVKNIVNALNPGKDVDNICQQKLGTCNAPANADFCEWTGTACGKASCGLSAEDPQTAGVCGTTGP